RLGPLDAEEVLSAAPTLLAPNALVFVPGHLPPSGTWPDRPPALVLLSGLLSLRGDGLALDRDHLEGGLATGREAKPRAAARSFPTPAGATWEDVRLTVADLSLDVEVVGRSATFTFAEAGVEDGWRREAPDGLWALLRTLAQSGGSIPAGRR